MNELKRSLLRTRTEQNRTWPRVRLLSLIMFGLGIGAIFAMGGAAGFGVSPKYTVVSFPVGKNVVVSPVLWWCYAVVTLVPPAAIICGMVAQIMEDLEPRLGRHLLLVGNVRKHTVRVLSKFDRPLVFLAVCIMLGLCYRVYVEVTH